MLSFVVCQEQQLRNVFTFLGSYQFVCASFCELRHSGFSPLSEANPGFVVVFVGSAPFVCFVLLLDGEAHIWLGLLNYTQLLFFWFVARDGLCC